MAGYGKFEVFSLHEFSSVGLNMVNYLKHIYPWWIWLSDSILINVVVVIVLAALSNVNSLFRLPFALAYTVEMSNFMTSLVLGILSWALVLAGVLVFHISYAYPPIPGGFLD